MERVSSRTKQHPFKHMNIVGGEYHESIAAVSDVKNAQVRV
jgi:hypothetical protein